MLVEDLFEQEEGFPQTWGPQEGLVDFVNGVPVVVPAGDASFLGEAAAAQRYDLTGATFLPHLVDKKPAAAAAATPATPGAEPEPSANAEDLARYLPVTKPTVGLAFAASSSNHSLLDGSDLALDFPLLDGDSAGMPLPSALSPGREDSDAASPAASPASAGSSRDEQRKQRNRESAARSRKRTRERMAYLENLVDHLMKKNRRLEAALQQLSGAGAAPVYAPAAAMPVVAMQVPAPAPVADDLFRQLAC